MLPKIIGLHARGISDSCCMDQDALEAWLLTVPIAVHVRTSIDSGSWDWWFDVLGMAPTGCELQLVMERGGLVAWGRDESMHDEINTRAPSTNSKSTEQNRGAQEESPESIMPPVSDPRTRRYVFRCVRPWHPVVSDCLHGRLQRQTFVLAHDYGASGEIRRVLLDMDSPGKPTNIVAVAGEKQAVVTFTAPLPNGGPPITSFTATSIPGSLVCVA